VLLSADGCTAKVADVGAAAMMDAEYISQHFGTLAWAAPELLLADRASQLDKKVMQLHVTCRPAVNGSCSSRQQVECQNGPEQ
jgi:hypothetical protein